jgi:hippurate hydrolase
MITSLGHHLLVPRIALTSLASAVIGIAAIRTATAQDQEIAHRIEGEYASLQALYTHLHAQPELSLDEQQTGRRIGEELRTAGFSVTMEVGGHGVVGVLRNGPGPTFLLRTDLDALPVQEQTGAAYASQVKTTNALGSEVSVMHACGHDVHMTVLVGTARLLSALKDRWHGTAVLIGQPAEEVGSGARQMLADGLFSRFPKPDFCLALHVSAKLPAGTIGYVEGFALANVDSVDLTIRGVGGHGAWPQSTKDPIVLAAETVLALQTIVSRETPPGEAAVVTVGSIHGGTKHNVIPDEVNLQLTLRSFTEEVRQHTIKSIDRIIRGLAQAAGVPEDRMPTMRVRQEDFTPALYNDPALTRRVVRALKGTLGEHNVRQEKPVMGGEDFSEYGRTSDKIPVSLFWLGAVDPDRVKESERTGQPLPSLHSSRFLPLAEPTIKTGIQGLTAAVFELTSPPR